MTPPTAIRRPVTITTWTILSVLCLAFSPLILGGAAVLSALLRRPQALVVARLMIDYFARELGVMVGCGLLWLAAGLGWRVRSRPFRRAHLALLRWYVTGIAHRIRVLLDIRVEPDPTEPAAAALDRDRPLLFFSRHAGPGDTVLLCDLLIDRYARQPSVVFKDALTIDPGVDLLGHRLPHAALNTSDPGDCEARIEQVARGLHPRGILMLFPEGGNVTAERRRGAIEKLWRRGRRREARAGEQMSHVMPPHPTGALAALRANPTADVVFSAHTGLGLAAFPRQLWRRTPFGRTLRTRMWAVPATERPGAQDPEAQVRWLYDWWARIDRWVDGQDEELPEEVAQDGSSERPRRS